MWILSHRSRESKFNLSERPILTKIQSLQDMHSNHQLHASILKNDKGLSNSEYFVNNLQSKVVSNYKLLSACQDTL